MNEWTVGVRLFALIVWCGVFLRFSQGTVPPPSRAGRYTGPLAMVVLLAVLLLGAVNTGLKLVPPDSLTGIYTLATLFGGMLGIAWLMLSTTRRGRD
jgi:hypothetical protein